MPVGIRKHRAAIMPDGWNIHPHRRALLMEHVNREPAVIETVLSFVNEHPCLGWARIGQVTHFEIQPVWRAT